MLLQRHYGIKEGEEITMRGKLSVKHGLFIKLFMPLIRLTGALVPVEGENFTVIVKNKKEAGRFYWYRKFIKADEIYEFNSVMRQYDDTVVEFVGFGLGIRMGLKEKNSGLVYQDKGYVLKLGKRLIPVPVHLLMGRSIIEEFTSEDSPHDIDMKFIVKHPWFGFLFSYMGYFNVDEVPLDNK